MRVSLITEGTYPVVTGGVSTWCDQLLRGMPEHEFSIVALTGSGRESIAWDLPANVHDVRLHAVWGPPPRPLSRLPGTGRAHRVRAARRGLDQLWRAVLAPDSVRTVDRATTALRRLNEVARAGGLGRALASINTIAPIVHAWNEHRVPSGARPLRVSDAVQAAAIVDRTLGVLDVQVPEVDVVHASSLGPSALVGLGVLWSRGTPLLLSEHGVYLRERYLALHDAGLSADVRRLVTAFLRRLCEVAYTQAGRVLPVNRFNARWERRLGAAPDNIETIPNGVDPERFPPILDEPDVPTISFVGRIDPLKDLETLIRAFAHVRGRIPEARLRLFGPVPVGNEAYRDGLVAVADELRVSDAISWEGPSNGSRPAFVAGQVIALSSVSEGLPFTVIEAMMCARPTVNTDVGGVSECLDEDQETGLLVPARDPAAFAQACIRLLEDPALRRRMGAAARERALSVFTLEECVRRYRAAYAGAVAPVPLATPVTSAAPMTPSLIPAVTAAPAELLEAV